MQNSRGFGFRKSVRRLGLVFFGVFFLLLCMTDMASAETQVIVGFDFENSAKRAALPDFKNTFYTADDGITANKNVSAIRLNTASLTSVTSTAWVAGSGGSGTFAPNAKGWNEAADSFWQISFSTAGYQSLTLSSKQQSSDTGPRDFKVQWSLNGSVWSDVPSTSIIVANNFTSGKLVNVSLPAGTENQNTLYLRWIRTSNIRVTGGTELVTAAGTNRIDDIIVRGEPLSSNTITYDSNGATGGSVPDNQTKYTGVALVLHSNSGSLVKTGHTFTGWNTAADGTGTHYSEGGSFTEDAAATLYAHWTLNNYTITFDASGGTGGTSGLMSYGAALTAPSVTREGYTFDGWSPSVPATVPAADATYTAHWTVNQYNITFDASGGTGGTSSLMSYGAALTAPSVTREGYTFDGWSPSVPATVPATDATYTAHWTVNQYNITFDANGGVGGTGPTLMTYGASLTAPAVTKEGYTFVSWSPAVPAIVPAAETTYTAQWTQDEYIVTYDPGTHGTFAIQQTTGLVHGDTTPPVPTITGQRYWLFSGWEPVRTLSVTKTVTYIAQWTWNPYVLAQGPVVFYHIYGGGGNINGVYSNDFVVLKNIGASPVNLDGWRIQYTSYNGTIWTSFGPLSGSICPSGYYVIKGYPGLTVIPPQAEIPYFHASLPSLNIHQSEYKMRLLDGNSIVVDFIGSGAADEYLGSGAAPKTASTGDERNRQSLIRNPSITNPYSGNNNTDYTIQSPTDLSYITDQFYTVYFDRNTGDTEAAPSFMSIRHGETAGYMPAEPVKAHHQFEEWNTAVDGSGSVFDLSYSVTSCLRVYAQWTQDEYTVTYDPGIHGTFAIQETTGLHYGEDTPDEPDPLSGDTGWSFANWDQAPTATVTGTITYTAQWTQDEYPLAILQQPVSTTVAVGSQGVFTVEAAGREPLTYQWYVNRNDGSGWVHPANGAQSQYISSPVTLDNDGYRYYCRVTDATNVHVDSEIVILTVFTIPQTGDISHPVWLIVLVLLSATGLILILLRKRYKA